MGQNGNKVWLRVVLGLLFMLLAATCLVVNLRMLAISCAYYSHDTPRLMMTLWLLVPVVLASIVLLIPLRILLRRKVLCIIGIVAASVFAHHMYFSAKLLSKDWLSMENADIAFLIFCILALCGVAAFVLCVRAAGKKRLPAVLAISVVAACFVMGSGNPQWSRVIYIYQVYYSPWKADAANLATDRRGARQTYPKYTEWDKYGRKTGQWSHPEGILLRTEYYPDGSIRGTRLYAEEQFVTTWYPNGQMAHEYDRTTRQNRSWNEDGSVKEGEITDFGENEARAIGHYKNGLWHGTYTFHNRFGLRFEGEYVEGRKNGVEREWHNNGTLYMESHWVDGFRDGPMRCWNDKGQLQWEKHFSKGMEVSSKD